MKCVKIKPDLLEYFFACVLLPIELVTIFFIPFCVLFLVTDSRFNDLPLAFYIVILSILIFLIAIYLIIMMLYPKQVIFNTNEIYMQYKGVTKWHINKDDIEKIEYVKQIFLLWGVDADEKFGLLKIHCNINGIYQRYSFRVFRHNLRSIKRLGYKIMKIK